MALTTGFQLPFGIQPLNPVPTDSWSGPFEGNTAYAAISAANAAIPSGVRFKSLEVRLIVNGSAAKYWYKDGVLDGNLVEFSSLPSTATFSTSVSAPALSGTFYGDGSLLTGVVHTQYSPPNNATFVSSVSAPALSGVHYGDGSKLTGIVSPVGIYVPLSGGIIDGNLTVTGTLSTSETANWQSVYSNVQSNSAQWSSNDPLSSYDFYGDGVTTVFGLSSSTPHLNAAGYLVTLNGATQNPFKDYTITYASGTNKLVTSFIPPNGCEISVVYLGNRINFGTTAVVDKTITVFSSIPANSAVNTFYAESQEIHYYTLSATNNFIINVVGSSTTTYNSIFEVNSYKTISVINTSGATAYAPTLKIDGVTQTVKWLGGQSTGNANGLDDWAFSIIKTGTSAYTVLGSVVVYS